ncbi:MAG: hypothetical protein Q4G09_07880 [Clostridia bacterium]|nr:hypothetical protein [Clostridia bacterium]
MQEIYDYGNMLEKMDILPNTVVARIYGEEILFREVETYRNSINNSIENGNEDAKKKNAFYEVLVNKLQLYLTKTYYNEYPDFTVDIDTIMNKTKKEWTEGYVGYSQEEYRKKLLDVLCIKEDEIWLNEEDFLTYLQNDSVERALSGKGQLILLEYMIERPELVKAEGLEEKIAIYKDLREREKKALLEEKNGDNYLSISKESTKIYSEIRHIYTNALIINGNLELCVDKKELSTKVPEIYKGN